MMALFDPLGFIANFSIKVKILMQDIWRSDIGWDDPLTSSQSSRWKKWVVELPKLRNLRIPRCYSPELSSCRIQLHVFNDASESAYASVCYFRFESASHVSMAFVCGNARVVPLKPVTVPKLELQAALLGTPLSQSIAECHDFPIHDVVLWSDSRIVLHWISSDAKNYKQFVANRVGEILEATDPSQWRWVPTALNVADDATRGETDLH